MFLLVGLASASICLWLIFAVRRRRKRRRLEHEAVLAAPNGHRSPLADEDDDDTDLIREKDLAPKILVRKWLDSSGLFGSRANLGNAFVPASE